MTESLTKQGARITLLPSGSLQLERSGVDESDLQGLIQAFDYDWRKGLFYLAAEKVPINPFPTLRYWKEVAEHFLTALCHATEQEMFTAPALPDPDLIHSWLLHAPPMTGGEYLSASRLKDMWQALVQWTKEAVSLTNSLQDFLQTYAAQWTQVGRVLFHLAENQKDPAQPFAFLATYATGFGSSGQLRHLPLKKALEQYSGENNRQALVKLLTPVQKAVQSCPWVGELVSSGELFHPLRWSVSQAHRFLLSVPQLEESGLAVRIPNWWKRRLRPTVSVTIDASKQATLNAQAMLNFDVELALGGEALTPEEMDKLLNSKENLLLLRGQWVEVNNEKLQEALQHWKNAQHLSRGGELSFIEGMRLLAGAPTRLQTQEDEKSMGGWVTLQAGETLAATLRSVRDPSNLSLKQGVDQLRTNLRPYQIDGVSWLTLLTEIGLGACLADDMGLGKTIQVLTLLLTRKQKRKGVPSLLIVPASLLANWKHEAERFTPTLKMLLLHPSACKAEELEQLAEDPQQLFSGVDLVVTTYSMLVRQDRLVAQNWDLLILDEAQAIKNTGTKQSRTVRRLKAQARIALTGTPIENRLSDLWSLFDFLNPGLLGTAKEFKDYITVLERNSGHYDSLRKLVAPYILRRMKSDPKIISDLPAKIETPCYCQLSREQVRCYQATVDELQRNLTDVDTKRRKGIVLQTLLRLKQICNHPSHYSGDGMYKAEDSGKFLYLREICEELASRQEKVLIFTQYKEIIPHLAEFVADCFGGRTGLTLHGGTPVKERRRLVEKFQKDNGPPFFILSLKAGGTGLTLTEASHVVHFDRWWNPAVENQATDRAFRIGQKKNVQVHTFITQGTVEEAVDSIINSKKQLAGEILSAKGELALTELSDQDLLNTLRLTTKAMVT